MKKLKLSILLIILVLVLDQVLKVYIKTNFYLNESVSVFGQWFKLVFVENPGMAFGWEFPFLDADKAKILLSIFRIFAVGVIGKYLFSLAKQNAPSGLLVAIALIFAGAAGNIIDSVFYGLIFSESPSYPHLVAHFTEFGKGYENMLTGRVVDMFRFDLFTVELPWIGEFNFFAPIFNLADVSITAGVCVIIFFQRKSFQTYFFAKKEQ